MKVMITTDEWYPVYMIEPDDDDSSYTDWDGFKAEVSQEFYDAYVETIIAFRAMQRKVEALREVQE